MQTAEELARRLGEHVQLVERKELLPDGDATRLLQWTARKARQFRQIAWVGHAPDVGRLAALAIGQPRGELRFSKGAVAAIRFDDLPKAGAGELRWLVTAKILGC